MGSIMREYGSQSRTFAPFSFKNPSKIPQKSQPGKRWVLAAPSLAPRIALSGISDRVPSRALVGASVLWSKTKTKKKHFRAMLITNKQSTHLVVMAGPFDRHKSIDCQNKSELVLHKSKDPKWIVEHRARNVRTVVGQQKCWHESPENDLFDETQQIAAETRSEHLRLIGHQLA